MSKWKDGHPVTDGVYWLSAKERNPRPFETLPVAWMVEIKDGFVRAITQGMKSYPVSAVETDNLKTWPGLKHKSVTTPADPWKERSQ